MSRIAELTHAKLLSYYWLAARLERFCLRRTQGVISLTGYTERKAAPYARKTWVVPNAVHQSYFEVPRSPANFPRILCAANVSPWKNQIGLIQALDSLQTSVPFELIFAGTGAPIDLYFGQFSRMVAERSWCQYLGPLDRQALQQQIAQATAGVLPSFEDNCPMVVLEAAAAGLPFAASRIGGIPDLIRHGETGLLLSPPHADEIRSAIMQLIAEPDRAAVLAATARREAVRRFTPIAVADKHLEIYREVLSSR
jgi:glycosyltransferase involved in cell wall biosynthesis